MERHSKRRREHEPEVQLEHLPDMEVERASEHHEDHEPKEHLEHCGPVPSPECLRRRLMESIALEELAIAHLINAEAEKTQAAAHKPEGPFTPDELIELDRSVAEVLKTLVAKEALLLKKLRLLLAQECKLEECDEDHDSDRGHHHSHHRHHDRHLEFECECDDDDCE